MEETWMPVPSYEGVLASNLGRIIFPERIAMMPNGGTRKYKPEPTSGHTRRSSSKARHTYMGTYNSFFGNIKIHRAVCEAFHGEKPFPKAVVIHLDEDATNNRSDNLKWGTQKENLNMPKFIAYLRSFERNENVRQKRQAKKDA